MPPPPPTDPYVHALVHTVRLVMVSLPRFAIRGRHGDPVTRYKALGGVPDHDSMTNISLPSTGSPRYRFPSFLSTMKMCDSLGPWHHTRLPSRDATRRCACGFAPGGPGHPTPGQGCAIRSPHPENKSPGDPQGLPSSRETPIASLPGSTTPAGPHAPIAMTVQRRGPR